MFSVPVKALFAVLLFSVTILIGESYGYQCQHEAPSAHDVSLVVFCVDASMQSNLVLFCITRGTSYCINALLSRFTTTRYTHIIF